MNATQKTACPQWSRQITEWASGTGSDAARAKTAAHAASCAGCARLAGETRAMQAGLRALPVRQTSPQFEAKLAARLASVDQARAQQSWLNRAIAAWQAWPRMARPALALGAMTAVAAGAAFFERPAPPAIIQTPVSISADPALVTHCVAQHQTDAAAQPLADESAQNLAAQADSPALSPAEPGASGEDNL